MNDGLIAKETAKFFEESLREVVLTVTGFYLYESKIATGTECKDLSVFINITGSSNGFLMLDGDINHVADLFAHMTGNEPATISDEDAYDCFCEIANMTCGNAKAKLAQHGIAFKIGLPYIITGTNKNIMFKEFTPLLHLNLTNGLITLGMRLVIFD